MADADILRHQIVRAGQSQNERLAAELGAGAAPVDDRTGGRLLRFLAAFAKQLRFHQLDGATVDGGWAAFLPPFSGTEAEQAAAAARLLDASDGEVPPHLGLLLAFLRMYQHPQQALNRFSARHLEFFLRRVLRFAPRPAAPDRAHVVVQLKKQAPPVALTPGHVLSAGKDDTGVELSYVPVRDTVVNGAMVASLRSIALDRGARGRVRVAPIANSSDGVGGKLEGEAPSWPGFGGPGLNAATVGFALASPVLRMREGRRTVHLTLALGGPDLGAVGETALAAGLELFLTGEKGWLGPYGVRSATVRSGTLRLDMEVPEGDGAVVDYDAAVHGQAYAASAPVIQVLLRTAQDALGYLDLRDVTVRRARIAVQVANVTTLDLSSDAGALDPKKLFLPFTGEPAAGSTFTVRSAEVFSKKLSSVTLRLGWHGAPVSFTTHYWGYLTAPSESRMTATVTIEDGGSWRRTDRGVPLFEAGQPQAERVMRLDREVPFTGPSLSPGLQLVALRLAGASWARTVAAGTRLLRPMLWQPVAEAPVARLGALSLTLEGNFGHVAYRMETVRNALAFGKSNATTPTVLNEPYTPKVLGISLDYAAASDEVAISSTRLDDFTSLDLQFFHVGCFGVMREHGHQRARFGFVPGGDVPLLPRHDQAGELLIGLSGLAPESSVSLLFQVAEGSADPDRVAQRVTWWALCDNYWKPLGDRELTLDTTNRLLASGLVQVVVPAEATSVNTILPAGLIWLRATVPDDGAAVSRLVEVAADAVEVRFRDAGNDPARLATPLPAKRIAKVKAGPAGVKGVTQAYASFGGAPVEGEEQLTRRATERLRHKHRCITPWDYERMVLERFPAVYRVKCVSHARDGVWLAPGHVLLVVIPDLRRQNARDPLAPKVDADTVSRIRDFAQRFSGMQVQVHVRNPRYQQVTADFGVRFRAGYEFNYYRAELIQDLIRFLSPWAYEDDRPLAFGGQVYRSVLLQFVESRPPVDYVTDFRLTSTLDGVTGPDLSEVLPATPDAILVSAADHRIRAVEPAAV